MEREKKILGLKFNADFSFIFGVGFPVPARYNDLEPWQKNLWKAYCRTGELLSALMFASNFIITYLEYRDICIFVTASGTLFYISSVFLKLIVFISHSKIVTTVMESMCQLSANLDNNPVGNKHFSRICEPYSKATKLYGLVKNAAIAAIVLLLSVIYIVYYFDKKPEDRVLPMPAWYPYDWRQTNLYILSIIIQFFSYSIMLTKGVAVDLLFLNMMVIFNTFLIYHRILLRSIVDESDGRMTPKKSKRMRQNIIWWIQQYQLLLRTIEDFKIISNPYLLVDYINVVIVLFLGGVLWTSDVVYDKLQQTAVTCVTFSNLLQLYAFSLAGDHITQNALRIAEEGLNIKLLATNKDVRKLYAYTLSRSKTTLVIRFGMLYPLSVYTYGQIIKTCFSYFITVVQIRARSTAQPPSSTPLMDTDRT